MVFRLSRLNPENAIADKNGKPTNMFSRFWDVFCSRIETQEQRQDQLITDQALLLQQQQAQLALINQALELAGLALETADGGGPNKSGSASSLFTNNTGTFAPAVAVNLTSVSAGNLALTGTGPSAVVGTTTMTGGMNTTFQYQIIEVVGGIDGDTVFTGAFDVTDVTTDEPSQIFSVNHTSAAAIASFFDARATTGTISYRVEVRKVSGANMTNMRFYLFVRRSV